MLKVGVARETGANERRVALVPDAAARLVKSGLDVLIESGAGGGAFCADEGYAAAGASLVDRRALLAQADVLLQVQTLPIADLAHCRERAVLIALFAPAADPALLQQLAGRRITAFNLALLPRITRAQPMDALSSQATIAGYRAVLLAASAAPRLFPMLVTAAGTLVPARVLVVGAGVAGLQAIATARRLGAVVSAFDVRPAVQEQVESLGATFVALAIGEQAETAGGYAKQLSADAHERELALITEQVRAADVVITTAQIPGKPAPRLITAAAVAGMKAGAVIVDLAAETGGNCELTAAGRDVVHAGVTVLGPVNLASMVPFHASQMYARNVSSFLAHLVKQGAVALDFADAITRDTCVTHEGEVRHR